MQTAIPHWFHRAWMIGALALLSGVLVVQASDAATYYVATTGSDSNPGTQAAPFRTICKGIRTMAGGDTLEIASGTYNEWISGQNNCSIPPGISDAQRTVIRAASGATVTIQPPAGSPFVIELWRHPYTGTGAPHRFITIDGFIMDGVNTTYYLIKGYEEVNNIAVINSELKKNFQDTQGGIHWLGTDSYFANLEVHRFGVQGDDWGVGVYVEGARNLFERMNIHDIYGSGIQFWNQGGPTSDDNILRNSRIYNTRQGGGLRGQCIIIGNGHRSIAYNNIIYNCGAGIESGWGAVDGKAYNNTVYGSEIGLNGDTSTGCTRCEFINNIAYGNDININPGTTGVTFSHNLTADPLFVDAAARDFRLRTGSPAIDAGVTLSVVQTDYAGVSRPQGAAYDIGAYEYVSEPPPPPPGNCSGKCRKRWRQKQKRS
jgi:hypothetical protein